MKAMVYRLVPEEVEVPSALDHLRVQLDCPKVHDSLLRPAVRTNVARHVGLPIRRVRIAAPRPEVLERWELDAPEHYVDHFLALEPVVEEAVAELVREDFDKKVALPLRVELTRTAGALIRARAERSAWWAAPWWKRVWRALVGD